MRGLFAVVAASLLLSACESSSPAAPAERAGASSVSGSGIVRFPAYSAQLERIRVETVTTERVPLDEVVAPGKIEAIPSRIARISMPVAGRVREAHVALGDAVRAGQMLLTIESPEAATALSAVRQAQARVEEARSEVAKAEADLTRTRDLLQHRAIAQKEVVNAETALAQARSALVQAESARREADNRIEILGLAAGSSAIPVRSPVSGKVLEIAVVAGEYRNDTSAPVLTIADLSTVYVTAEVPETDIRLITVGEMIELRLAAYPGEKFRAKAARIADTVNPETRTIRVMAQLPNPGGRLRPDMFGEIRHQETFRTVPVISQGAVVQKQSRNMVWVERSVGVFEAAPVEVGKAREGRVPVTSGLRSGERVVTDGVMLLESGS